MQPHEERVIAEKAELDGRITNLKAFFDTEIFATMNHYDAGMMLRQHSLMVQLSAVLGERIKRFPADQITITVP